MKWENTSQVDVRVDGVVKGTIDIDYNRPEGKEVLIPFLDTTGPMSTQFELLGKENEKLVWRKVLNVRTVPETTVVSSALSVDFENGTAPFLIYNENTAPENGWRIEDGRLRVGTGSAYVPNVKSTLSLFAKLEKVSSIQFDAVIDSEADYDGILINVVVDGIRENLSFMSGKHSQSTYMLDLSKYQGKNVEIQFEFKSDGNTEGSLVAIDNILLK